MSAGRWLVVALAFAVTVDARGNKCRRNIKCYYHNASLVPGTYETNGVVNSCVKGPKDDLCYDMKCVYGSKADTDDPSGRGKCPSYCGDFDVLCECVTQEYAINENQKTKDTIITIGWIFFGLMFVVPAIGVGLLNCCCAQHRPGGSRGLMW